MDDLDRMFRRLVQNIRTGYPDLLSRPFEVSELYQNIIPYRHNRNELGLEQNQDYEFALLRLLSGERGYLVVDDALRAGMQRELASPNPDTSAFRAFSTSAVSLSSEAVRRLDQYLAGGARADDARLGRTAPRVEREPVSVAPEPRAERPAERVAPAPPPPPPPVSLPPALAMDPAFSLPDEPSAPPPMPPMPTMPAAPRHAAAPPPPPAPPVAPPRSLESDAAAATIAMPPRQAAPRAAAAAAGASDPVEPARAEQPAAHAHGEGRCQYCGGALPTDRRVTFCPHCGQNITVRHCPACSTELEIGWKYCITCGRGVTT